MAHRRSHAVINFNELVGANECPSLTSPSPPHPSSSTAPKRPLSAFKARKKRGLSLHVPADDFVFNLNDIGSTIHGEPVKLEDASFPCSSVTDDDALALMRNMSITPRSNSNSSNSSNSSRSKSFSFSFSPTPAKTVASKAPEPSVPLFLVPNWETPAILASEYRIVGILGKGSYSVVYDAIQMGTMKRVAIKAVNKARSEDKRLVLEISVLKRMKHPNIVRLFEVKETPDTVYLITEKVGGGELFVRISEHGAFSESCAKDILRNILHAVAYLHSQGIVHRDLKPENILLPDSDDITNVKIVDFGVATLIHSSPRQFSPSSPPQFSPSPPGGSLGGSRAADGLRSRSRCFSQVGSLQYMAPEVIDSNGHTKSVDLWSVGVVLHILLVGYPPFQVDSRNDLKVKAIAWEYGLELFSFEGWESISEQAKNLVTQLLALDPAKRITAAAALRHPWLSGSDDTKPVPLGATHSRHIKRFAAHMQRETARARSLWTREAFFSLDNSLVVEDPSEFTPPVSAQFVPSGTGATASDAVAMTPAKSAADNSETKTSKHMDGPQTTSAHKRRLSEDTPGRPPRLPHPRVDAPLFSPHASRRRVTHPLPRPAPASRPRSRKKHSRSGDVMPSPYKLSRTGSSPKPSSRARTALPFQRIDFGLNPFPHFALPTSSDSSDAS